MGLLSRKSDPLADAQAEVDRLGTQRSRLADRLAGAVTAVEAAQTARRAALVDGDPDAKAMATLDRRCADAAEARSGVEAALTVVTAGFEDATARLAALQDASTRARIAAEAETRAKAIDAAGEALAAAAKAFGGAREAMVRAIGEHGAATPDPVSGHNLPAALTARPIITAAIRAAAPGILPTSDTLGAPIEADPALAARRLAGRLRDHGEDVLAGRVPAVELPRPGQAALPIDPSNPLTMRVEKVRVVVVERLCYIGEAGRMIHSETGEVEIPKAVFEVAREAGWALEPGTRAAKDALVELGKAPAPGYMKTPGRQPAPVARFVDVEAGAIRTDAVTNRPSSSSWPDRVQEEIRSYHAGRRA